MHLIVTGRTIELEAESYETIAGIKGKVQGSEGIPPYQQELVYSGKELNNTKTLLYYNIQNGATIHLILRLRNLDPDRAEISQSSDSRINLIYPSRMPFEPHSLSSTMLHKAEQTKEPSHEAELDSGQDFDDDDYLINPETHYRTLDTLEKEVVEASEFYHTKGSYEPTVSYIDREDSLLKSFHCKTEVWRCLDKIADISRINSIGPGGTGRNVKWVGLSLGKCYLILCQILDSLKTLTHQGFCKDFFTILIQRESKNGDIAELVKIERKVIIGFHEKIARTIMKILNDGQPLSDHVTSSTIRETLMPACDKLMEHLEIPLKKDLSLYDILILCRILVLLLDLGLVSYMGSHGSRFDTKYMAQDHSELLVVPQPRGRIGFQFTLKRLACLDEFLNHQQVWIFQPLWIEPKDYKPSNPISILTSVEAFADTWGPIWEVSAGEYLPNYIRQLNVSTGLICRVQASLGCAIENAIPCHWFNSSGIIPLPSPWDYDNALIRRNQKLLIGGLASSSLTINGACSYKLDDLESHYGLHMTPMGTAASSWVMSERQVGFSASQYVGITLAGIQKKSPCVTQKQAIWNKWTNQPTRANPRILNSYLGVEISHCTGNARRVRLRDLFTMKPVQALIERQFPDWISSEIGMSLQAAFYSDQDSTIEDVWVKYYKSRNKIAEIVCCVLEILEKTGAEAGKFSAAFLNQNRELSMPLQLHLNSWAEFLGDSHLTAVYAIVNETCLDSGEFGYFVSTCNSASPRPSSFTVLGTQIAMPHSDSSRDRIFLNQRGCLQRLNSLDGDVQVLTWDAGRARELRGQIGRFLRAKTSQTLSREVQDRYELGGQHVSVLVKSTTPSFGGLPERRKMHTKILAGQVTPEIKALPHSLPTRSAESNPLSVGNRVHQQDRLPRPSVR